MSILGSSSVSKGEEIKKGLPAGAKLALLAVLVLLCGILGVSLGSTIIDLPAAFAGAISGDFSSPQSRILLYVRLPRVSAAMLAGSALAVSGMLIQAVLNNPLAAPNVIGVNAGAGFFTFLAIAILPGVRGAAQLGAFFGALFAVLLVCAVSAGTGRLTIILSGVAVSSIFTAGINTVKTFCPDTLYNGSTFLIGGFSGISLKDLSLAWAMILAALIISWLMSGQTDLLGLGEASARSLGMNVGLARFGLIIISCILAGCAVSFSGLLSFVGLLAPHMVRRIFGEARTSHRVLIPAAALLGAGFVTLCDLLSRILFAPYELPVGILLSALGGPFFLALLLRERRRRL
ncbi:MAG: iron ABC transporter permease [Acutalibacter sp.]|jgi:iron complex transport system permease protein|uniref:FecCD family ABC transporter permease n=1 Tax=Acutalibacter sp. TaxID=1918636 RepID=UPI00217043D8|nr:iron ABC transporter permease [Acutalibacter sp.]MCI9224468.1 iron ABC transporter permease [Acutalibacter sp.]